MKIDLSDDQIDSVIVFEMKRHARLLKTNIRDLKNKKTLKKFEKEDLLRFEEVLKSMNIIIGYYS